MLAVIIILQIFIIGLLLIINEKIPKRDYIKEALKRDEQIRLEKEKNSYPK
ncbi:hypothetical protein M3231_19620 [Neobacillus mesonae]|nr:hypothetical protein [Neobacillus mesonae]